jgi:parvulin-like peptidyl-prolyl isomerase
MKRLVIVFFCIAVVSLFSPAMVFSGGKSDKSDTKPAAKEPSKSTETTLQEPVVATVQITPDTKKDSIFRGQLKTEVERLEKTAGRALSAEERRQVLDVMINERLAVQAAEREKITITDNELNQQIAQLKTQMAQLIGRQPTDDEFARAVKDDTGLEVTAFKDQLRRQLIVQRYLMAKKAPLFDAIKAPTEDEIRSDYNLAKAQFVRPETVRFSMIQVPFSSDTASKTKAKETADRLVREIGSNASKFDEAAAKGQASGAGYQAGDGGYLPKTKEAQDIVGQEFVTEAFRLAQGQVSKLMEGAQGYQLIKITEKYPQKELALDDIFQLGTRMTVRDYIGNVQLRERQQTTLARASQELVTDLRSGKPSPFTVNESNLTW